MANKTIVKTQIANAIESVASDHIVTTATQLYDEEYPTIDGEEGALGEYQSEINKKVIEAQGDIKEAKEDIANLKDQVTNLSQAVVIAGAVKHTMVPAGGGKQISGCKLVVTNDSLIMDIPVEPGVTPEVVISDAPNFDILAGWQFTSETDGVLPYEYEAGSTVNEDGDTVPVMEKVRIQKGDAILFVNKVPAGTAMQQEDFIIVQRNADYATEYTMGLVTLSSGVDTADTGSTTIPTDKQVKDYVDAKAAPDNITVEYSNNALSVSDTLLDAIADVKLTLTPYVNGEVVDTIFADENTNVDLTLVINNALDVEVYGFDMSTLTLNNEVLTAETGTGTANPGHYRVDISTGVIYLPQQTVGATTTFTASIAAYTGTVYSTSCTVNAYHRVKYGFGELAANSIQKVGSIMLNGQFGTYGTVYRDGLATALWDNPNTLPPQEYLQFLATPEEEVGDNYGLTGWVKELKKNMAFEVTIGGQLGSTSLGAGDFVVINKDKAHGSTLTESDITIVHATTISGLKDYDTPVSTVAGCVFSDTAVSDNQRFYVLTPSDVTLAGKYTMNSYGAHLEYCGTMTVGGVNYTVHNIGGVYNEGVELTIKAHAN